MIKKKLAVLSDIHGNSWALQAVLDDMKSRHIDVIVNLGDSLYGPLDPLGTFRLLSGQTIVSIAGNEDRLIFESYGSKTAHATLAFVCSQINKNIVQWLQSLEKTKVTEGCFLCHGTPQKDDLYLFERVTSQGVRMKDQEELQEDIKGIQQSIICCGHSHVSRSITLNSGTLIVNPGSVGCPAFADDVPFPHRMESGSPHSSYAILTLYEETVCVEHIAVSYDWHVAARCAKQKGRDDWAKWLITGKT
jgi:putative phosphoesterase